VSETAAAVTSDAASVTSHAAGALGLCRPNKQDACIDVEMLGAFNFHCENVTLLHTPPGSGESAVNNCN